jgi:hypothetical protein
MAQKIIFSKYVHELLLPHAWDVERLRRTGGPSRGGDEVAQRLDGRTDTTARVNWDDRVVRKCFFVPGLHMPSNSPERLTDRALSLGKLDPVVISEVLGTLGALASKGK